jgi:hypothetical protein
MAIYCEAISVLVRKETIKSVLRITPEDLIRKFPGGSCWQDETLIRFGFMAPQDAEIWLDQLVAMGMTFVEEIDSVFFARDIVVVDQTVGPTCECNWIASEIIDGYRWAWEAGMPKGTFDAPSNLAERDFRLIPQGEFDGLPVIIESQWGSDQTIDQNTGDPTYIGRVYKDQQLYDDQIRRGIDEYLLNNAVNSYELFLNAERIKPLAIIHRIPAAIAAYEVLRNRPNKQLALEVLRRWVEITEIGPGEDDSRSWLQRSYIERYLRLARDSRNSALKAAALQERGL